MSKPVADHVLALIKAGVSAVPIVGGTIGSLIGDYVPTATQRSIDSTVNLLRRRLADLEGRIDADAVNKDEFSELWKSCYLIVVRTHQESKLRAAAALMANILLKDGDPEKLSYTELDHFVRCVDALSIGAIEALGHTVLLARRDIRRYGRENVRLEFADVHRRLADFAPDLLMGLLQELNSFHLVHLEGSPGVRTPNYANYPIELPPIGARFATHVMQLDTHAGDAM